MMAEKRKSNTTSHRENKRQILSVNSPRGGRFDRIFEGEKKVGTTPGSRNGIPKRQVMIGRLTH